jgi:hypothetical protein
MCGALLTNTVGRHSIKNMMLQTSDVTATVRPGTLVLNRLLAKLNVLVSCLLIPFLSRFDMPSALARYATFLVVQAMRFGFAVATVKGVIS